MAEIIRMPKLSDTMTEGVVSEWHKNIGDEVSAGDLLAEIETDKANMEFESYSDGILLHIGVEAGSAAPINSVLAVLGEKGEEISDLLKEAENESNGAASSESSDKKEEPKEEASAPAATNTTSESASSTAGSADGNVKASPLAKSMAKEQGIDISAVQGSGPDGRVVKRDIEEYKGATGGAGAAMSIPSGQDTEVPHSMMRKTIARRLSESKFSAPHFYLTMEIDMDRAIADRKVLNQALEADGKKVSFNDLVMKACALALRKNPKVNSQYTDTHIIYKGDINIGMAVAVEAGLVVPVITNADYKSLPDMATEARALATKAKEGKLQPKEMEGNTFTVSNLGMAGIESFTSIINAPSSCIMAVGAIRTEPVVKDGEIVVGNRMKVTMSCDHRAVDGAVGSDFLVTFKQIMENPLVYLATM